MVKSGLIVNPGLALVELLNNRPLQSMATRFSKPNPDELADSVFQLKECACLILYNILNIQSYQQSRKSNSKPATTDRDFTWLKVCTALEVVRLDSFNSA